MEGLNGVNGYIQYIIIREYIKSCLKDQARWEIRPSQFIYTTGTSKQPQTINHKPQTFLPLPVREDLLYEVFS